MLLEKEYATTTNEAKHEMLEAFRGQVACPECKGARLRPEARAVRLAGKAIHEATAANVAAARAFFQSLEFPEDRRAIAEPITSEILSRLDFLAKVGLGYLTLDRPAETLSGGELQRGSAWPAGWARGWSAYVTCSTNLRSGCIPAITSV